MGFSPFLESRRGEVRALVQLLKQHFAYVSGRGSDIKETVIRADRNTSGIRSGGNTECGFVVKAHNGNVFFEYSLDDITGDIAALADKILEAFRFQEGTATIANFQLEDAPLKQSFSREDDLANYTNAQLLDFSKKLVADTLAKSGKLLNVAAGISSMDTSKLFISANRELDQHYVWINGVMFAVYKDNDKVVQVYEPSTHHLIAPVLEELPRLVEPALHKADCLTRAKPIEPGVYDVITDPSITGLIAHEAFGHGVEMDQFVKDRALAKEYVGKYVASPICNMRDGAGSVLSAASYFFDDDGVLAGDTQIIKDGILVTGISDMASAAQLGTAPTGNGRRQSTRRKAYARMTNTFFEKGTDKLEDMIASIDHGYMLFETDNGMEDPKNWAIQCVAQYGIEIRDGKLTDNYVSPVVMSGYVPDLLKSISMISDDFKVIGAGGCGKGYKEWVRVSDGGPALKAKVKLG